MDQCGLELLLHERPTVFMMRAHCLLAALALGSVAAVHLPPRVASRAPRTCSGRKMSPLGSSGNSECVAACAGDGGCASWSLSVNERGANKQILMMCARALDVRHRAVDGVLVHRIRPCAVGPRHAVHPRTGVARNVEG